MSDAKMPVKQCNSSAVTAVKQRLGRYSRQHAMFDGATGKKAGVCNCIAIAGAQLIVELLTTHVSRACLYHGLHIDYLHT